MVRREYPHEEKTLFIFMALRNGKIVYTIFNSSPLPESDESFARATNVVAYDGIPCRRIARLLKSNNKLQDPKPVTAEHVHNARLGNAHKVVSEVVSRSAVSRNSPNSIKTDQGDILLYGTSINRNTRSSQWNEGVNFCI